MMTREMNVEIIVKGLVRLGMLYRIQRGQFALDENLDRVALERWIYFYVCELVSRYIALDIEGTIVILIVIPMIM